MPIDDTIKLVCQAIITIGYVTYQIIYALRQHNRRRRREKTKEP
ncbi:MAG: hypothetical protein N2595_09610 [bacterium]|nr:hypothetical protein [bacterium]